jgi:hypothetical protein
MFYTIEIVYCQDDMFRHLLGHLQALTTLGDGKHKKNKLISQK